MNLCLQRILPEECTVGKKNPKSKFTRVSALNLLSTKYEQTFWYDCLTRFQWPNIQVYRACFANIINDISELRFWASKNYSFTFGWFSLFWMRIDVFCGRLCLFFFCEKVILETSESTPESLISTISSHQPLKWKTTQRNVCKMASNFQPLNEILVIVLSLSDVQAWCQKWRLQVVDFDAGQRWRYCD